MGELIKNTRRTVLYTVRHKVERALKAWGYPYRIEELDGYKSHIRLDYQGADFYIRIDESDFIRIQMIDGAYVFLDDVEGFSILRRAVNEANWNSAVTIVYTPNVDKNIVVLNFKSYAFVIHQIPCFETYLKNELNEHFYAQQNVWLEMERMKRAEDKIRQVLSLSPDEYYIKWKKRMAQKRMKQKDETQDLFLQTLEELGCHYSIREEENCISFYYKMLYFVSHVVCGTNTVLLHLFGWKSVDLNDIHEVMRVKQAINTANIEGMVTTFYENDYDEHELVVSSSSKEHFSSHIEDRKIYLRDIFDSFIQTQQKVDAIMEELRAED